MSSSEFAIRISNLSHEYKLYPSPIHMCLDISGINKIAPFLSSSYPVKKALLDINLNIKKGEKIGLIGRNGAGKTTFLKILSGILSPTCGQVIIDGKVQSLITSGLGFHPELTGRENIQSSLAYNNLENETHSDAVNDIIAFCELGDYIDMPLRTYSLGMQSRLAFATATAINPEILIIDEVLGAGDAYFINKSSTRINNIIKENNSTLILASHSTSQILKFCDKCIWINDGTIMSYGDTLEVVKAYDKHILAIEDRHIGIENEKASQKNISRWKSKSDGCYIKKFEILNSLYESINTITTGQEIKFLIEFEMASGVQKCYPVIFIYTESGDPVSILQTEFCNSNANVLEKKIEATISNFPICSKKLVISVAIYKTLNLNSISTSEYFDLIDRSFFLKSFDPDFSDNPCLVNLPTNWKTND